MQQTVKLAYTMGYRVQDDGSVVSAAGKTMALSKASAGYLVFSVRIGPRAEVKNSRSVLVHQLAALQWYGEQACDVEVRHLDGNKTNNSRTNITTGTHRQNMMDIPPEERLRRARAAAKKLRKLTEEEVKQLRQARKDGASYKELMGEYGVAKSTVSYIVNQKTYRTLDMDR